MFFVFDGDVWNNKVDGLRKCTDMDDGKRVAQEWFEELMREGLEEVK